MLGLGLGLEIELRLILFDHLKVKHFRSSEIFDHPHYNRNIFVIVILYKEHFCPPKYGHVIHGTFFGQRKMVK